MGKRWRKCVDGFPRAIFKFLVITKLSEAQKIQCSDRARGRLGTVIIVLHPQDDTFVISTGAEIAATFFVKEQTVLRLLQLEPELQPFDVEGSFVEVDQSLNDEGVIIGEAFNITSALAITSIKGFAFSIVEICPNKFCGIRSRFEITRFIQNLSSARV